MSTKQEKINLEFTYDELQYLSKLVLIGEHILNFVPVGEKKRIDNNYTDIKCAILDEWRKHSLKNNSDIADDIEDENDYQDFLLDWVAENINKYDNAIFPELLATKLINIRGGTAKVRDKIVKSKLFDDDDDD